MKKILIEELDIEVEDISDYDSEACDILDNYCELLSKQEGMTRAWEEGDGFDGGEVLFMWTSKGSKLIEEEMTRLCRIGIKYFGEDECKRYLDIKTSWYRED